MKYALHFVDLQNENPWEDKAVYLLYTELLMGFLKVILYLTFITIMMKIHTFPLFAIRPMYLSMRYAINWTFDRFFFVINGFELIFQSFQKSTQWCDNVQKGHKKYEYTVSFINNLLIIITIFKAMFLKVLHFSKYVLKWFWLLIYRKQYNWCYLKRKI